MTYSFRLFMCLLLMSPLAAMAVQPSVYGKWVFEDFVNRDKIDEAKLLTLEDIFGKMYISFHPDGTYDAGMMGQKDKGTWEQAAQSITMQSSKPAQPVTLSELEVGGREMTFVMSQVHLKMKRAGSTRGADNPPAPPVPPVLIVPATMEQIASKWELEIRTIPGMTESQKKLSKALSRDAFFQFKDNGKFKSELLGVKDKGSWKFGADNKSLEVAGSEGNSSWKIVEISDSRLVLMKGETQHRWEFAKAD